PYLSTHATIERGGRSPQAPFCGRPIARQFYLGFLTSPVELASATSSLRAHLLKYPVALSGRDACSPSVRPKRPYRKPSENRPMRPLKSHRFWKRSSGGAAQSAFPSRQQWVFSAASCFVLSDEFLALQKRHGLFSRCKANLA